jgi:hypothetical protein
MEDSQAGLIREGFKHKVDFRGLHIYPFMRI